MLAHDDVMEPINMRLSRRVLLSLLILIIMVPLAPFLAMTGLAFDSGVTAQGLLLYIPSMTLPLTALISILGGLLSQRHSRKFFRLFFLHLGFLILLFPLLLLLDGK